jgi:hypothetical protein
MRAGSSLSKTETAEFRSSCGAGFPPHWRLSSSTGHGMVELPQAIAWYSSAPSSRRTGGCRAPRSDPRGLLACCTSTAPLDNSNLPWQEDVEPDTGSSAFGRYIGDEMERPVCSARGPRPWRIAPTSPPEEVCRIPARPLREWAGELVSASTGRTGRPN